jgi:membrane-associated protease RseP (regulator of RpoE activity)
MKTLLLSLTVFLTCTGALPAAEPQVFDLGNGAEIVVKDGRVEVRDRPGSTAGSVSNSVSCSSDGKGGITATVASERDGQRVTRTVTISPDGKVSVDGQAAPEQVKPATPARTGGWMGVRSAPVSEAVRAQVEVPEGQGVVLEVVAPDGPAARAGLAVHDILLVMNGEAVKSVDDFRSRLQAAMPEQKMSVTFLRKGRQSEASVTLGAPPVQAPTAASPGNQTEAERLLREMQERMAGGQAGGRTVVVGPDGKTTVSEGMDAFEMLLKDPNLPETMKEQIRKARESVKPK